MAGNSPGQRQGEPPAPQFPEHQEAAQIFNFLPSALPTPEWTLPQISPSSHLNQTSPHLTQAPEGKLRDLLKK